MSEEDDVGGRLTTHEAVCVERHLSIGSRLLRIEAILISSAGATIMLLIGIIAAGKGG